MKKLSKISEREFDLYDIMTNDGEFTTILTQPGIPPRIPFEELVLKVADMHNKFVEGAPEHFSLMNRKIMEKLNR